MESKRNKDSTHEGGTINIRRGERFSQEQIQEIRDATIMYGGDRNAAARYLGIHPASIENHARDLLESQHSLSQNKINIIKLILPILNYSKHQTEKFTQISYQQIKECLEKGYIEIPKRAYVNAPIQEEQNVIIKSFDKHGKISLVHQETGIDVASIAHVLRVNNIQIDKAEKSKLDKILIIQSYRIYNQNAQRASLALGIDKITIEKNRYKFHLGTNSVIGISDQEIYERFKDKKVTKLDYECIKRNKLKNRLKKELNLIKEYRSQIRDHLSSPNTKPSVKKISKQIGIFRSTGVRKLTQYGLFDPAIHSFNAESCRLPTSIIFETHCKDSKLLSLYNELFLKYNNDKKMKEHQIKKFIDQD